MKHTLVGTFCVKRRKGKECVGSGFSLGGRSEKVLALHWAESIATPNTSHFMRNHGLIRPITFCPCFSNCLFVVFTLRWIFLRILTVDFYAIFKIVYQSNIYFFARNLRSFPVQFIKHYLETPCYWKRMNSSLSLSIRFFFNKKEWNSLLPNCVKLRSETNNSTRASLSSNNAWDVYHVVHTFPLRKFSSSNQCIMINFQEAKVGLQSNFTRFASRYCVTTRVCSTRGSSWNLTSRKKIASTRNRIFGWFTGKASSLSLSAALMTWHHVHESIWCWRRSRRRTIQASVFFKLHLAIAKQSVFFMKTKYHVLFSIANGGCACATWLCYLLGRCVCFTQ